MDGGKEELRVYVLIHSKEKSSNTEINDFVTGQMLWNV